MIVMVSAATTSWALTVLHHRSISAVPFCPISRNGIFFDPRMGLTSRTSSLPNGNGSANACGARQRKIVPPIAATAMARPRQRRTRHNSMITSPYGHPGDTCKHAGENDAFECRPAPFHRGRAEDLFEAPMYINEERNHGS